MRHVESLTLEPHPVWVNQCRNEGLEFELVSFGNESFQKILGVRQLVYGRDSAAIPDRIDSHSEHYLAILRDLPVAALRVTRATSGSIDCEEFFAPALLDNFSARLCSATRFVALPQVQLSSKIPRLLVEVAWLDQIRRGIRLDVINVHERAVRYYGKLGYELVADSYFVHPLWNSPSYVMLLPATENRDTPLRHVFEGLSDPLEIPAITEKVRIEDWKTFHHSK